MSVRARSTRLRTSFATLTPRYYIIWPPVLGMSVWLMTGFPAADGESGRRQRHRRSAVTLGHWSHHPKGPWQSGWLQDPKRPPRRDPCPATGPRLQPAWMRSGQRCALEPNRPADPRGNGVAGDGVFSYGLVLYRLWIVAPQPWAGLGQSGVGPNWLASVPGKTIPGGAARSCKQRR